MPKRAGSARQAPRRLERQIQAAIVRYHELSVSPGQALLFAVPNGEQRDPRTAQLLVAQGVYAGAPDLILLLGGALTVLLEIKRPATLEPVAGGRPLVVPAGRQSRSQEEFQALAEALGHRYVVVRSIDEYVALLAACGIGRLRPKPDVVSDDTTPRGGPGGGPEDKV